MLCQFQVYSKVTQLYIGNVLFNANFFHCNSFQHFFGVHISQYWYCPFEQLYLGNRNILQVLPELSSFLVRSSVKQCLECRPRSQKTRSSLTSLGALGKITAFSKALSSFFLPYKTLDQVRVCVTVLFRALASPGPASGAQRSRRTKALIPWQQLLGNSCRVNCLCSGDGYDFDLMLNNGLKITRLDFMFLSCSEILPLSFEQILL